MPLKKPVIFKMKPTSNWFKMNFITNITDRLKDISVPTLMVGATYDTMDPKAMKRQSGLVQDGQSLTCENGSHLCMWDDRETFMSGVAEFIAGIETR